MKLSELSRDNLQTLPDEAKTRIVFGGTYQTGGNSIAALLLGCGTAMEMTERALAAAALFQAGRTPCIIPTGAPVHQTELGDMTEAAYMAAKLREAGIPDEAVILEDQAMTTIENMLYGELAIEHAFHPHGEFPVHVVTSATHMRRSLAIADVYLPRTARILGHVPEGSGGNPTDWPRDEFWTMKVNYELLMLKVFIDQGEIPDIEF